MYTIEKDKGPSLFKNIDWYTILNVLLLNGIGLLVLKSVSTHLNQPSLFMKQLLASVLGITLMFVVMIMDYKDFKILSIPAFVLTVILLVAVLIFGKGLEEVGTNGWLDLGPLSFQPSELGKITLTLVAAYYFERIKLGQGGLNYIMLLGASGLLIGLVLIQPDFGTGVVYIFMLLCMLFVFGIKYRFILITLFVTLLTLPLLWFTVLMKVLKDYQINRILSFLNMNAHAKDSAYQVKMAIRYIGSGMLTGEGYGQGMAALPPSQNGVPASPTDSIFAVVGNEFGFIGAVAVILLFTSLLLRCLYISRFSKDKYGAYIVIGIMAMFFFHFVENIGMNLGLLPVTGIPLPFISYGGTSVVAYYIAVGILISISMRRQRPMFEA